MRVRRSGWGQNYTHVARSSSTSLVSPRPIESSACPSFTAVVHSKARHRERQRGDWRGAHEVGLPCEHVASGRSAASNGGDLVSRRLAASDERQLSSQCFWMLKREASAPEATWPWLASSW